jgi:hypothetical protein
MCLLVVLMVDLLLLSLVEERSAGGAEPVPIRDNVVVKVGCSSREEITESQ